MIDKPNQPTWLYVFAKITPDDNRIAPTKIGVSKNPAKRLIWLQTACPFKIGGVWAFEFPNGDVARFVERGFHATHEKYREFGEWYELPPFFPILVICNFCRYYFTREEDLDSGFPPVPVNFRDYWFERLRVTEAEKRFAPFLTSEAGP